MAWETRQRGELYYVQKTRHGKKVRSEYVGCGETAQLVAQRDRFDRAQRESFRLAEQEEQAEWMALDKQNAEYCAKVEGVLRQVLEAAGYHQHHRGEWRRRRGNKEI